MKKIYTLFLLLVCLISVRTVAQCTTPATVPYYEGFNNITVNNQLPICWAISNTTTCITFTNAGNPNNGAGFYYLPGGTSYFYSNAIQLTAGITYSAASWFKLTTSSSNWGSFNLSFGTSQTPAGLVQIASTPAVVTNTTYAALTNTFAVSSSGIYYIAVGATSSGGSGSFNLLWDDLSITIPCTSSYNTPTVTVVGSATSICSGQNNFTATASGADTYVWSTGSSAPTTTDIPVISSNFSVIGTNTLTGCTSAATLALLVLPSPAVFITSFKTSVCMGSGITLNGAGASTYTWSNGTISPSVIVIPTVPTTYTVFGTGANGCTGEASQLITIDPLPVISFTSSAASPTICAGETVIFTAQFQEGLAHYWNYFPPGGVIAGDIFTISPAASTTINLQANDENGCYSKVNYFLIVDNCTGINKLPLSAEVRIYPNPGNGDYIIESGNPEFKTVVITDLAGKVIFENATYDSEVRLNIKKSPNGIYQVKINSASSTQHIKLIKE